MRPKSIVDYERAYLVSIFLGLIASILLWPLLKLRMGTVPLSPGALDTMVVLGIALGIGINCLLLWLTARKGNQVARILVALLFAFGIVSQLRTLLGGGGGFGIVAMLGLANGVLEAIMLYLLFVPRDSKAWFARGRMA